MCHIHSTPCSLLKTETRHICHFRLTDLHHKGRSTEDHRHGSEITSHITISPLLFTYQWEGFAIEDLECVLNIPATSSKSF